jgi:hypothetical protein
MQKEHEDKRLLNVLIKMSLEAQEMFLRIYLRTKNPRALEIYEEQGEDIKRYNLELKQYD